MTLQSGFYPLSNVFPVRERATVKGKEETLAKIQMGGLICTTSAPTGDGMFVLGHAENSQTSDPFAFSSKLISLFTLFTFQN